MPELKKLEVIDAGAADAKFREVRFSDGGAVASFTAGAVYVAEKVAAVVNGPSRSSYTTPIVIRGTFNDGTQSVILNTKITFVDLGFPLGPYLGSLDGYNPIIGNIDFMDIFRKGEMTIDTSLVVGNDHKLTITCTQKNDNTCGQFILYNETGEMVYGAPSPYYPSPTPSIDIYTINKRKKVTLMLNIYEPDASGKYAKLVTSQNATIYFYN